MLNSDGINERVRRAQGGDRLALNQLLESVRPYLRELIRKLRRPPDLIYDRPDLLQDVLCGVLRSIVQFRLEASDAETGRVFQAWLRQIGINMVANRHRRRGASKRRRSGSRRPVHSFQANGSRVRADAIHERFDESTPLHDLEVREQAELLRQAIAAIEDPAAREIVRLRHWESLSLREIGKRLGLSQFVASRLYRDALADLRFSLKNGARRKRRP